MDRFEAARALSLADADVLGVEDTEHGAAVTVRDGGHRLIAGDGVYALTDHPTTAQLRRHAATKAKLTDGEYVVSREDTEAFHKRSEDGEVPTGSADDVLKWVGEDAGRAAEALAVEEKRDHPRSVLIGKLRKLAGS